MGDDAQDKHTDPGKKAVAEIHEQQGDARTDLERKADDFGEAGGEEIELVGVRRAEVDDLSGGEVRARIVLQLLLVKHRHEPILGLRPKHVAAVLVVLADDVADTLE